MPSVYAVSCATKDKFCSRRCALAAARHMLEHAEWVGRRRPPISVFLCPVCSGWHLGGSDLTRPRHARRGTY